MDDIEEYKDINIDEMISETSGEEELISETVSMPDEDIAIMPEIKENKSNLNALIITISVCVFIGLVLGIIFGRKAAK